MTVNWDYIRQLYLHQTGEKKSHKEICRAVLKEIDDFLEGNTNRIFRFILPDGSPTFTITPLFSLGRIGTCHLAAVVGLSGVLVLLKLMGAIDY